MKKLSLVVPCYNEENTLFSCITGVMRLKSDTLDLEVIIVDDCSSDNGLQIARQLAKKHANVVVLRNEVNRGKGAALRVGFEYACRKGGGDYIGVQDADNEYNPMEYKLLLEPLMDGRADAVYGSRYLRQGPWRVQAFWHTQVNHFLTLFSNMFTNLNVSDVETCYKLFRSDVIRGLLPRLREDRFGFDPEVTALVAQMGCSVYECPISYNPRGYEQGKKIGWRDGISTMYCILRLGLRHLMENLRNRLPILRRFRTTPLKPMRRH
ncbi:MAG: glycosyltransferase family 2 protein [Holosporaceae bacterium]|jgi:glycosyltransferase involved in cell wall biosynthesis|nr:glycosyltransferase family 2 protein [Holosporaceae bacterium]